MFDPQIVNPTRYFVLCVLIALVRTWVNIARSNYSSQQQSHGHLLEICSTHNIHYPVCLNVKFTYVLIDALSD